MTLARQASFIAAAIVVFALAAPGAAHAELEPARVGFGNLTIGGLLQVGLNYYIGDEILETVDADLDGDGAIDAGERNIRAAVDRESDLEFVIRRARLTFRGNVVDDRVGYFLQMELADEAGPRTLDALMAFSYIPYTSIAFGRYNPRFTYWNPMFKGNTFLVRLPQMNDWLGVQRQTGAQVSVSHKYVDVDFGATNGRQEISLALNPFDRGGAPLGTNTQDQWDDENTAKDVYGSLAVKPIDGLRLFGGYWYGTPLDYFEVKEGEKEEHNARVGIANAGLVYLSQVGLNVFAEGMYEQVRFDNSPSDDPNGERPDDTFEYDTASWYAMLAFNFKNQGVPLELVARYDWLDPDLTNDADTHGDEDEITHITAGLNYYIESYYAMLSVNYVYKAEAYEVMNKKLADTQTGIADDELLFQTQIAF
ncbi:hypothetical protein K8I61_11200 [bacterium]|nr:hypothetical protein [bacterium]